MCGQAVHSAQFTAGPGVQAVGVGGPLGEIIDDQRARAGGLHLLRAGEERGGPGQDFGDTHGEQKRVEG